MDFFSPQQQMEEGKHVLLNKQCVDYKPCKKWLKQKEMFLPDEVIRRVVTDERRMMVEKDMKNEKRKKLESDVIFSLV